jgi:hypothetical protein
LWTKRIWDSIPEGTRALIRAATISIDAAKPETYAENRRGGNFQTLLQRLAFIAELRVQGPLEYLEIHMTVQVNNYREMPQFVELGRRHHCDRVTFQQMLDWGTFSPQAFASRAVQHPRHPEHAAFLSILSHPALEDPIAYLSNLTEIKNRALGTQEPTMANVT